MWSGGDVEGRLFGGNPVAREAARHLWGTVTLPESAVDLSVKPASRTPLSPRHSQQTNTNSETTRAELIETASPSMVPEEKKAVAIETDEGTVQPLATTAQPDLREFTSIKEVLLEMTNRKNGHTKLPVARWSIIKKEPDQLSLKVSKYAGDDKKGAFPRPTALVNPFPADIIPLNGSAQVWLQAKPTDASSRDVNKNIPKVTKQPVRQRVQKNSNGRSEQTKKLNTIVAQLKGSLKASSTSQLAQNDQVIPKLLTPVESVSFLSSNRLTGGEVSLVEQRGTEPDLSVVDRLKRLGTVIELEDQPEPSSLKLLEKMTKSVPKAHSEDRPKTPLVSLISKQQVCQQPLPIPTLYISKDVTLIPKITEESISPVHDKLEPSVLEPVIDILEEENILNQDGTFFFKTDSYFSVDLPNSQKVFSCDICSAVYSHSNMLRKHYLRLHISRKYISEKDMETFNIDPEQVENKVEKLIFRCHTCRECFSNKNDLKSHLTDHPPVDDLVKQNNKIHPTYKCENCPAVFKWRKLFGKHKKICKPSLPSPSVSDKPDFFHCLYCNETFLNANSKRNHILSNHPYVRRKHYCMFCKKDAFTNNVNLFSHLVTDHPTVYFGCQLCKERYTNLEELKAHVNKKHANDEKLKSSVMDRTSTIEQEQEFYTCDVCQRKFLIENSFKEHVCFPEKQEKVKPKLQKIKKKVYPASEKVEKSTRNVDAELLYYNKVAANVRDNLLNHLDGKIYKVETSKEDNKIEDQFSPGGHTRTLNFSAGFPSSSEIYTDNSSETPSRSKAQWEKYSFPKKYDGRCGLTSYIKDTAYLDISTQLIMRRNLQRLKMLPIRENSPEDVPSVLALERLSTECAESFGQIEIEKDGVQTPELGELSGEWVRERMYVCSACHWETPCLWTMEDHKYLSHPQVHCPQHELIGEQAALSQTIYKRLYEVPSPYQGPSPPTPPLLSSVTCTKCSKSGFNSQAELHAHILECAGVVLEPIGPPSSRRKRRSTRRRPRRGLKRNIPSTPQKLPTKPRTKPGDTDTIQRMIANLPPKRVSRKVFSPYEDLKSKNKNNKNGNDKNKGKKSKPSGSNRSHSEPPTPTKEEQPTQIQVILQKPTVIKKEQDYIDTSAEGGDVLSSLRMMPVRSAKPPTEFNCKVPNPSSSQTDEKEMPKLEIEKDLSPVESAEIPVLSPVERKDDVKKDKEDLICGISFIDGLIKYETVASVSQETKKMEINRKRKSNSNSNLNSSSAPKRKRSKVKAQVLTRSQLKDNTNKYKNQGNAKDTEVLITDSEEPTSTEKDNSSKRRGRPKGSLTRRFSTVGSRRSNRISRDSSVLKFDEILPCDEEEIVSIRPEKPKRKPRTIKNAEKTNADSTIIVVKAEIHPEPVTKRKIIENEHNGDQVVETMALKKFKGNHMNTEAIGKTDVIDIYTFVEETTEINLSKSLCKNSKIETYPKGEVTQKADCIDIRQIKTVPENCGTSEETRVRSSFDNITGSNNNELQTSTRDNCILEEVKNGDIMDKKNNLMKDIEILVGNNEGVAEENEVTISSEDITKSSNLFAVSNNGIKNEPLEDILDEAQGQLMQTKETNENNKDLNNSEECIIKTEEVSLTEVAATKRKKTTRKTSKLKKRGTQNKCNTPSCVGEIEKKTEKLSVTLLEKSDGLEKTTKVKKAKKTINKDKEEEVKRPKKLIKKKKVIKKIVKLKKRRPSKSQPEMSSGSEVLNIAGFKWEVSELASPSIKDDVALAVLIPKKEPESADIAEDGSSTSIDQSTTINATSHETSTPQFDTPQLPVSSASTSTTVDTWDTPPLWASQIVDPSLGSIIDSVNKLLNEPESTYTPLGLPSYSLLDLQKAMGASDDEMAVLQQLGEASSQVSSTDGSSSIEMKGDSEEWNAQKCIMDLDNQSTASQSMSLSTALQVQDQPSCMNQANPSEDYFPEDSKPKEKEEAMPNSLLAAHQGKEVLCPSCSCHFMGFPALQQHLLKVHPSVGPKGKSKRSGTTSSKIDLSRRMPLDSSQGPRLICYICQQILPSDRMSIHLEQEHSLPADDVSKCSSLSGDYNDGPVVGERLKSKMSSALGGLLDRAVINLLMAKHKPNNTLSGGAVDLLTKLCSVWKREGSMRGRLQGARELLSKLQNQKDGSLDEDTTKIAAPCKPFSCTICGQKFSLPSSRNKHEVLAHRSFRISHTQEPYEMDEYDNDWREAPSPPEVHGDNGNENAITPQCSDCGLSFESIQEMMRHRLEDHTVRRSSVDASNLSGCCPSPVPSSGGSHSLPDSEAEDSSSSGKRRKSTKAVRLGSQTAQQAQAVSRSVKERAEAALRELNLPRQRTTDKRWTPMCNSKQKADIYSFTDESL